MQGRYSREGILMNFDNHPRLIDALFLLDCVCIVGAICGLGYIVGYLAEWFK